MQGDVKVMNDAKTMARLAIQGLEDKKANDIHVLDIGKISVIADYFIIASGSNRNQVQAMADNVEEILGKAGYNPRHIEGYQNANWILMDYGDVVLHLFDEENRLFYDLERIWRDGTLIDKDSLTD
jgi:ribosome-associated protein